MFRTKKDVDKHVQDINAKIKNPTERSLKGYSVAKLYYQVGDFENARKYLAAYLAEKDSNAVAHKLNGQIFEALKQAEKALTAYRTCYQLDTTQRDVLMKILQLLIQLPIEPGRTKYWVEIGEKAFPNNESVFRLKEALLTAADGEASPKLEEALSAQLLARPKDVHLRIRLIRFYQRAGRIKEGFDHAVQVEAKRPWPKCLEWYGALNELLENFQVQYASSLGKDFYIEYLSCLDSCFMLETKNEATVSRLAEILYKMDQTLSEASTKNLEPFLLAHFRAQLFLHTAVLILKRCTKETIPSSLKENQRTIAPLLLAASAATTEVLDSEHRWNHLRQTAAVRRSTAGHCLLGLMERYSGGGAADTYRERLAVNPGLAGRAFNLVFVTREQRAGAAGSFINSCSQLLDKAVLEAVFPTLQDLVELDRTAADAYIDDLNCLVWLLLRYYQPGKVLDPGFPLPSIAAIPEAPLKSPATASPLNQLDVQSFLYAATYVAGYQQEGEAAECKSILPPHLAPPLTTTVQEAWWNLVLAAGEGNLQPADRRTLQHGIDAIRCLGLHGLDVPLLLKLGKTYECLALEAVATADTDTHATAMAGQLEARAATYYKAALSAIEKLEKGVGLKEPAVRLFQPAGPEPSGRELTRMRETARFYLACQKMHLGQDEEALAEFRELKSAYAAFYIAQIYKRLALEERINTPVGELASKAYIGYLHEAREALYLTLDRLKTPPAAGEPAGGTDTSPLNQQLGESIEEVENLIATCGGHTEDATDSVTTAANGSFTPLAGITPRRGPSFAGVSHVSLMFGRAESTPNRSTRSLFGGDETTAVREEARPSPERLDAQIRSLSYTQDTVIKQLREQTQAQADVSRSVLAEVRDMAHNVREIALEMRELRQELATKQDTSHQLLQKIIDKLSTANTAAAAPAESQLSEEERLLLESFGVGVQQPPMPPVAAPGYAAALYPLLQQQQLMFNMAAVAAAQQQRQQLVPQYGSPARPILASGLAPIYPGPQLFGGGSGANPAPLNNQVASTAAPLSIQQKENIFAAAAAATPPARPRETPGPPTNVVISRSDRIPSSAPPPVSMSVTVPPQHRLGGITTASGTPQRGSTAVIASPALATPTAAASSFFSTPQSAYKTPLGGGSALGATSPNVTPHNYQIPMPDGVSPLTTSPFMKSELLQSAVPITTRALLSNIPTPIYSAVTPSPEKGILSASGGKARMASGGGSVTTPKTRQPSISEEGGAPEEYEPQIEFQPVVPLPEEVEVVTGEESETVLFEERAKLFRFADETKEWKERGVGQAKILRNVETSKVRFLMRRDQTFKVCANHSLLPDIRLDAMKGNAKARVWGAQDFADGELKTEKFCIRFKTEEQAEAFQAAFTSAAKSSPAATSPKKGDKEKGPEVASSGTGQRSLAEIAAAQKTSSWECSGCLTRNDNSKIQCLACEGPRPGHEEEAKKLKDESKPPAAVMTLGAGGGFKFSTTADTATTGGFIFGGGAASTTPAKPAATTAGITFGTPATATSSGGGLVFGTPKTTTSSLGGFTFATPPTVEKKSAEQEKKAADKKPGDEAPKPSPFAGFSFGAPTTAAAKMEPFTGLGGFGAKVEPIGSQAIATTGKILGGDSGALSFVALAQSGSEGFKADPNFKGFAGAGTPLFGGGKKELQKETTTKASAEEEAGADEEYEPDVQFQPVVPLPELIEVKTGEEDEDVLFSERSKLFRFVSDTKEWKERGVGDFKILKNRLTGRVRFLMRREQVLKLCCNHFLLPDVVITRLNTSDRAWTWSAADFAESELTNEVFALKFKTAELAANWKAVVDKCQKEMSLPSKKTELAVGSIVEQIATEKSGAVAPTSLAQFAAAQKAGSWECGGCLTRNENAKLQCLACEAAKPGHEEEVKKMKEEAVAKSTPVMTIGAQGGFKFGGSGATATPTAGGFSFGVPGSGGLLFGTATTTTASPGVGGGITFGSSIKPSFGDGGHEFSFAGVKPAAVIATPTAKSPRKHNESTTSENELYQEEEGDNLYFEPVIPLPDKVEVKTGEEDETVLYTHRAKAFRYTDGEWKERGLGDIKILKHQTTGKVRLLMRREQVHKICLNHYVTPALVASAFKEKDPKSWTWAAQDYSDGELTSMTFALRFKSADVAMDFKTALDAAMSELASCTIAPTETAANSTADEKMEDKPKTVEEKEVEKVEELFKAADFFPAEEVEKEEELSFEGQGLKLNTEEDAKEVAANICGKKTMHTLTLAGNTLGIDACKAIGEALAVHPEFRRAHWKDMFTGRMKTEIPPALQNLGRGIMTAHARLVELDLSDNAFGPIGMEGLVTLLRSPSCFSLRELRLNNTGCGVTGGKLLAKTLLECYHASAAVGHPLGLRVFVLGRSRQENEGAKALAEVFKLMGTLEEVVMPQNGIYHEGLTALADAFSHNPNLRILNMNDNTFTDKGARAMGRALRQINGLEVLNLGDCLLKSAGAKLIARALKGRHPNLKELDMDSNEIRTSGGLEVLEAMVDKPQLERLSLDGNQFGEAGAKSIKLRLKELNLPAAVLQSMEDNEEPDEDEVDPDLPVEDEEEAKSIPADASPAVTTSSASLITSFSFTSPRNSKPLASIFGGGNDKKDEIGADNSSSSLFGGKDSGSATSLFGGSGGSVFSGGGAVFGSSSGGGGLFGKPAFGSAASTTTLSSGANIFGTPKTAESANIEADSTTTPSSIFGSKGPSTNNIFGSDTKTTSSSIFGSTTKTPTNSIFGADTNRTPSGSSIFGVDSSKAPSSTNLFGSATSGGKLFGSDNIEGFSSLAASAEKTGFGFGKAGEGFKFAGAGSTLFSSSNKKKDAEAAEDEEEGEVEGGDEHDPHFEPVIPLPELVESKTGEEEEEVIFKHRAKVYRYDTDTKEWKERGVGDIKILKHPERGTYRVLLRRDQVLKVACNHLLTKDMELKPLASSETAWCWYAMDFSEGCEATGSLEQLAVRFKTKETAMEFKTRFEACQKEISNKNPGAAVPHKTNGIKKPEIVEATSVKEASDDTDDDDEDDDDDDGEEAEEEAGGYEDEDDDVDNTPMFESVARFSIKRDDGSWDTSPGEVVLRMLYDGDVFGARVIAEERLKPGQEEEEEEEPNMFCNHLIATETRLEDDLSWSALDFSLEPPTRRTFRAEFDSETTVNEFRDIFAEGKDLAEQSDISENLACEEVVDPSSFIYGVGGD